MSPFFVHVWYEVLVCTLQLGECGKINKQKEVFVGKCKVWKLKEPEIRQLCEARLGESFAGGAD
jgi:hypothetical protein